MEYKNNHQKGFTLIELLVVIGILAVLLAIVLIAINPARQFSQANDTKRRSDVNALLNAVHQYAADNRGVITALNITEMSQEISNDPAQLHWTGAGICTALVPTYIAALPTDPALNVDPVTDCGEVDFRTGYFVSRSATDNRITVSASGELVDEISVTR
jgi:prepilin-type N-terminal cleavage/methylation domain-containing protein